MIKTYNRRRDGIGSHADFWADAWSHQEITESFLASVEWDRYPAAFSRYLGQESSILEAGCGLGKYAMYLERQGHRVIGIDLDAQALARAHQVATHVPFAVADVTRLPFADHTLDAYVSLGVIEHFERGCQHVLAEARRVLKHGGLIFVTVPYFHWAKRLDMLFDSAGAYQRVSHLSQSQQGMEKRLFHQFLYTRAEIVHLIHEAGFTILDTMFSGKTSWFLNLAPVQRLRHLLRPSNTQSESVARPANTSISQTRASRTCSSRTWKLVKRLGLLLERVIPGKMSAHTIMVIGRLS